MISVIFPVFGFLNTYLKNYDFYSNYNLFRKKYLLFTVYTIIYNLLWIKFCY